MLNAPTVLNDSGWTVWFLSNAIKFRLRGRPIDILGGGGGGGGGAGLFSKKKNTVSAFARKK